MQELPPDNPNGRGDLAMTGEGSSGWVTTKVAAAALGVAVRTVRDYIQRGELAARREGEGVQTRLLVSVESLQELRARRSGDDRGGSELEELAEILAAEDLSGGTAAGAAAGEVREGEVLRELLMRLEARSAEAGELRARLQLTERAESTLREDLERERHRAEELEAQLLAERGRSWWRRLLGR